MTKFKCIATVALLVIPITFPAGIVAQSQGTPDLSGTALVYETATTESYSYVYLSGQTRSVFTLAPDKCSIVSTEGAYVAEASDQRDVITIRQLSSPNELYFYTPWNPDWATCAFIWIDNNTIAFQSAANSVVFDAYDVQNFSLVQVTSTPEVTPTALPDMLNPSGRNVRRLSPDGRFVLYEACANQGLQMPASVCSGVTSFVLYDLELTQIVTTLQNVDGDLIRGFTAQNLMPVPSSPNSIAWSLGSRFLAYPGQSNFRLNEFPFYIYDVQSSTYLNTDWYSAHIDYERGFRWAPSSDLLAFWIIGRIGEPQAGDDVETLRTLVFFDAETQQFVPMPTSVNLSENLRSFVWHPEGDGIAYVDASANLGFFYVGGQNAVIDTNVDEIVSWILAVESQTETPTLTPTPDQTP